MNIINTAKYLVEMGAVKQCPNCGHPMANYHYYYKGEWKCKSTSINNPAPGYTPTGVSPATAGTGGKTASVTSTPPSTHTIPKTPPPVRATSQPTATVTPPPTVLPGGRRVMPPANPGAALQHDASTGNGPIKVKITKWLEQYDITKFTIHDDLTVDVHQDVTFMNQHEHQGYFERLPVKFGIINGSFDISVGVLTSCHNFPEEVEGDCVMSSNKITSLVGCPKKVGTGVSGGDLIIDTNPITSIDGISTEINGDLIANSTLITSLEGICDKIQKINGDVDFSESRLNSHVLGVLEIDGVTGFKVGNSSADKIIAEFFSPTNPKDVFDIQNDLIEAGFDENFADL